MVAAFGAGVLIRMLKYDWFAHAHCDQGVGPYTQCRGVAEQTYVYMLKKGAG